MKGKSMYLHIAFGLGLGLSLALLWVLSGGPAPVTAGPVAELHVCPSGCSHSSLQTAVDAAGDGDVIKVAAGTYSAVYVRPRNDITTTGVVTQVVYISKTVTIQGGYTTTNWITADPEANSTILDAQGEGRVLYIIGETSPTIAGLKITGGDASGLDGGLGGGWDAGAGVYVISATATISDNWIYENSAGEIWSLGGGVHLQNSNSTVSGNTISGNTASFGGGVQAYLTSGVLSGNTVISNTATWGGGGMCLWGGDDVIGNVVVGNATAGTAGGMFLGSDGRNRLVNNVVADNYADGGTGGLYIDGTAQLWHTTVARNTGGNGSGISVHEGFSFASVAFTNTIVSQQSVGISVTGGNTATVNGILWYATPVTVSQAVTAMVEIQNQHTGDPAFADDGYHITAGSAAVDRGIDAGITVDIDGEPRPAGAGCDLGADELRWHRVYLPLVIRSYQP